ncbi:hypothetical protein Rhopal_006107-T1 [Rhodotorula paludigena]|uniref:Transmembrane protein n=1 Tax=Rhodotorula paludigena TaxID=86838 RepID=A0AAV5GU83_9BASI|nr:hypothetical protein Rhopal_006107-T1 [Rhodotorula paludigena]
MYAHLRIAEIVFFTGCRKSKEPWYYVVMVIAMTLLDLLHSGFAINTCYHWMVTNFGNPSVIAISPWYAHRIWMVSEKSTSGTAIAALVMVLSLIQFGFAAAVSGKIVEYDFEFLRFIDWLWGACVWLGIASIIDLVICAGYFHYLTVVSSTMAGPFERSTKSVVKVASIILATNGLSAAGAIVATLLFGIMSRTNWHAIPQLCLLKLLTLSLLIALNARTMLADLLGVDAGYFQSFATKHLGGVHHLSGGQHLAGGSAGVADGIYGRSAAQAGFDAFGLQSSKSLRSPTVASAKHQQIHGVDVEGNNKSDLAVRGPGGVVYPVTMPKNGSTPSSDEDDAGSLKGGQFTLEDEVEHGTAPYARQPFARAPSDQHVTTVPTHPYAKGGAHAV